MELAQSALVQVLLGSRDIVVLGKVLYDLLAKPAALEYAGLGVGEPPLQVGHVAIVGRLLSEVRRVLLVDVLVRPAQDRPALPVAITGLAVREVDGPLDERRAREGGDGGRQKQSSSKDTHCVGTYVGRDLKDRRVRGRREGIGVRHGVTARTRMRARPAVYMDFLALT